MRTADAKDTADEDAKNGRLGAKAQSCFSLSSEYRGTMVLSAFSENVRPRARLLRILFTCRGKCSQEHMKKVKTCYLELKEGSASFTELLRVAQYSLGTEHFFALMVSLRSYHLVDSRAHAISPAHTIQSKDSHHWRKLVQLRIFARVFKDCNLGVFGEVDHVTRDVYEVLEVALRIRLRRFMQLVLGFASRRHDITSSFFKTYQNHSEPKQKVRNLNVNLERHSADRLESERQVLLRVGDTILSKRKRDFEVNKSLKEKVEKVRQEEEDRLRATVTNDAARSALGSESNALTGEAKYLKWYDMAKYKEHREGKPELIGDTVSSQQTRHVLRGEDVLKGTKCTMKETALTQAVRSTGRTSIIFRVSESLETALKQRKLMRTTIAKSDALRAEEKVVQIKESCSNLAIELK